MLHNRILVTPDPKVMRDYRRAEDDIARYMADRAAEIARELGQSPGSAAVIAKIKAEANEHLVRIAALRRLAALAKMSAVDEWVGTLLESGAKVVLAAHHRDIVNALAEKFGGLKIQGGMLVQEVEDHKSRFMNEPEARVITLSIQAAKTGHTLTAAQDIAFVELPFTPADLDQTAARCHRIGQVGVVTAHYILAAGTIDEKIDRLIAMKRSVVDAATDGIASDQVVSVGSELVAAYLQMGLEG
jgi:SWI/SNF-related matrix-associated actin-dependent regulator 1 of chromatin subfamily A